jgi:hypothetical protein
MLSAASSVIGSTMGGSDMVPNAFYGGDVTADGSGWTVATGSARATGTPSGAMAEWLTPAVIVVGIVVILAAAWKRS